MAVDNEYIAQYEAKCMEEEVHHAIMRPIMFTVGVAMFGGGAFLCLTGVGLAAGGPMALFGLDMITSGLFGHSITDVALTNLVLRPIIFGGRNTTFMGDWWSGDFSIFQFSSNHLVNLAATQILFMILGGIAGGLGGLRAISASTLRSTGLFATTEAAARTTNTIIQRASLLMRISQILFEGGSTISHFVKSYLTHHLTHFMHGALFLYTLGAIGTAFGDSSLFMEIVLQGMMIAQIVIGVKYRSMESQLLETELYKEAMIHISRGSNPFTKLSRAYSIIRAPNNLGAVTLSSITTLMALGLASQVLQIAVVLSGVM